MQVCISEGIGKGNPQKKKLELHVELLSLHLRVECKGGVREDIGLHWC